MNGRFLSEHMRLLAESLLAQTARIRAGGHAGIKGASIEVVLRRVLRDYLPGAFAVGTGQVANVKGRVSPQIDILLYAGDAFPHLSVNEDGSVVVCCESVLSVVESKTSWDGPEVSEHFRRFCEVENERHGYYGGKDMHAAYLVFVVEASRPSLDTLKDSTRMVGVYSLEGSRSWHSPYRQADFDESKGNALELFLSYVLQDCMRKGAGEIGTLEETYDIVSQYFGWG